MKNLFAALVLTFVAVGSLSAAPAADSAWLAKAKASYPLTTCVVSGEDLAGGMGDAVEYVYHRQGRPDRLVRFCCPSCIKKFVKNPEKYLKALDAAAAKLKKS